MEVEKIVVHCSDSQFGHALMINDWHTRPKPGGRGWSRIGYHAVIGNGRPVAGMSEPWPSANGSLEWGRPLDDDTELQNDEVGAHAYGWNRRSLGLCLIGKPDRQAVHSPFTPLQFMKARQVVREWLSHFGLDVQAVVGHYELDAGKTCPGFDMQLFRRYLDDECLLTQLIKREARK